ncbi:5-(carboxyamino)imidazole ribonucleotide synthase [Oceanobacillus neutriphilus]|uniref:N5-carboxyaminoimidazole ribonucleotide synthase n=1 Tax=Oceanobacillus neutriphilus TaxID=531815 RepID=A0ABQ2NNV4_9BACI|nr:5-(carboxyamino)imidazole ribonucleotide synthase [Oceanobacillus neutriphilus]GGP08067.1 N5-carboxyaminoimidazole ribonucleotide synthase [Oceanobacillus neutriphilus]
MQPIKKILPPQTIGIIGGGQLGRMMAIAARYMGYRIIVLDPAPNCPTAQVADGQITADYADLAAVKELIEKTDVITYEFENVDLKAAELIQNAGKLPQGALALEVTQNREKEKLLVDELELPVPAFRIVKTEEDCREALSVITLPAVIKTCRGGYDGKGQLKLVTEEDKNEALTFFREHGYCIIERWIPFDKEISVVFTRSQQGDITFFPIAENDHRDHILYKTTVPADVDAAFEDMAYAMAAKIAERMEIVGTFAIEMFVGEDTIYINEMAPRPHNSGHYTIEGCNISQFAQHIRAVCGLPLIPVNLYQPTVMVNILGESLSKAIQFTTAHNFGFLHLYGKEEPKEKRKMGHITFTVETSEALQKQLDIFEEAIQQ